MIAEFKISLKWYGFNDSDTLPAVDVAQNAHLLMKKFVEDNNLRELERIIQDRQNEIDHGHVNEIQIDLAVTTCLKIVS